MSVEKIDNLVLGTVNASFWNTVDAETLAVSVKTVDVDAWLSHIATFFTEVKVHLVLAFAKAHGIPLKALAATYAKIKVLTGEVNRALDAELSRLAIAA